MGAIEIFDILSKMHGLPQNFLYQEFAARNTARRIRSERAAVNLRPLVVRSERLPTPLGVFVGLVWTCVP